MTARQCYESVLIELNKENAPNILLEDFNYLFNKGINQYVNKRYNIYDVNQQTTDDLRVLKATALLKPKVCKRYGTLEEIGRMMGATYELILPSDYLHILNCICIYKVNKTFKCYNKGDIWRRAATRLTADAYSQVLDNFWLRPTYRRPYYYIHNVNESIFDSNLEGSLVPTDPIRPFDDNIVPVSANKDYYLGYLTEEEISSIITSRNSLKLVEFLNSYGRTNLEGETITLDNSHGATILNGVTMSKDAYVITPLGETVTATTLNIDIDYKEDLTTTIGNYTIKVLNSVSGIVKVKGELKGATTINIGTDVKRGSATIDPSDYEVNNETSLGTDEFGNTIVRISKNGGVATGINMITKTNADGDYGVNTVSNIERAALVRYGNSSSVRMEIRYGTDNDTFELTGVYIDYIKVPLTIRLTLEQLDIVSDTSQVLEFPDYVCQEIINELVNLVMENISDPRLQTHPVVSLSIANPAQQLTEPVAQLS